MSTIVTNAYAAELERYHNWVLRGTMKVAFNAAPGKAEVLKSLKDNPPDSANANGADDCLYEDITEVSASVDCESSCSDKSFC